LWVSGISIASFIFLRVYVYRYSFGILAAFVSLETTSIEFRLKGLRRRFYRYSDMSG
jgi:hypothetical protein